MLTKIRRMTRSVGFVLLDFLDLHRARLPVVRVDPPGQRGGQGDPAEVGHHEEAGGLVDGTEGEDAPTDCAPQHGDLDSGLQQDRAHFRSAENARAIDQAKISTSTTCNTEIDSRGVFNQTRTVHGFVSPRKLTGNSLCVPKKMGVHAQFSASCVPYRARGHFASPSNPPPSRHTR